MEDVVVDGLGHADDRALVVALLALLVDGLGARVGAVAAEDEERVDPHLLHRVHDALHVAAAAGRAEDGPALEVDVADVVAVELELLCAEGGRRRGARRG